MRWFRGRLVGFAATLPMLVVCAMAQDAPKAKETVEVSGRRPAVQNLVDRQSYSIEHDLQGATGSISDVLKNLPAIEIDALGGLSLRGDPNVTILIDGKVSPLLAGNRADALEQIPADTIDRVEIITNPSAEFKAEGSGGIINIITKKGSDAGYSGSVRVNVGNDGRLYGALSGAAKLGKLSLNARYSERRDIRYRTGSLTRTSGTQTVAQQTTAAKATRWSRWANLSAGLELNDRNTFDLELGYSGRGGRSNSIERDISGLPGAISDTSRTGLFHQYAGSNQAKFGYTHKFRTKGEEFEFEVSRGKHWEREPADYSNTDTATGLANYWQHQDFDQTELETEVDSSYVLPLESGAKLKTGYSLQDEGNHFQNNGLYRNAAMTSWAVDPTFFSNFALHRTIHAAYATYEDKFGAFGLMGGLRLEQEFLSTNERTLSQTHKSSDLRYYPSLHLTYDLTDTKQLKLSYARRVNRPDEEDLSPTRETRDAFNVRGGNPLLKPEEIDSIEAAYQYTGERLDALVTGYVRRTKNGITDVSYYISPTILLTTKDNLAKAITSGVEATANGDLFKGLKYRLTASAAYSELDPGAGSIYAKRSGLALNAKAGLDYQITLDDLVQFSANFSGKRLLPQGYRDPTFTASAGFRHSFSPGLAAVFTVNNLFDSFHYNTVWDSAGVLETNRRDQPGRVMFLGLVYTFGSASQDGEDNGPSGEE